MKQIRYFTLALALGAILTVNAFAQKGPSAGGGPVLAGPNHFGLTDSCWGVFLAGLSASDAAKITADQQTLSDNQTKIDGLQKQINDLLKNGGARDSVTRAQVKVLDQQIRALNDANSAAQLEIGTIIKANGALLASVEENCGKPKRDTGKGGGNPGPGRPGGKGHFGLSDSCWNIFLTQISAADAAGLAADAKTIADNEAQIDTLQKQIHALLRNGGGKDSTIRAEIKVLAAQIDALRKASEAAAKDYATIIKNNQTALQSIRQGCGRPHKTADPGNTGLTVTDIVPNPASVGGTIGMTITLDNDAEVAVFASVVGPQGPPSISLFSGMLTAGSHAETFSLGRLPAGAYLVTIQAGQTVVQKKLVVQ